MGYSFSMKSHLLLKLVRLLVHKNNLKQTMTPLDQNKIVLQKSAQTIKHGHYRSVYYYIELDIRFYPSGHLRHCSNKILLQHLSVNRCM